MVVKTRDYYELLGISRDADDKQIKSAYRKLAMKYHPDRNIGDKQSEAQFKEITQAYEVLRDKQKRAMYDQYGHAAFEAGGAGAAGFGAGGFDGNFGSSMSDIFEDLFGDFMGGGRTRQQASGRGGDLRFNLEITLSDAFAGKTTKIRVPSNVACAVCFGSGAKPGTSPGTCSTCGGAGKVRTSQGFLVVERTCLTCRGRGQAINDPCINCQGMGRVAEDKSLAINIPAGVEDGTRIRLANEGEAGLNGAPPGDLYIFITLRPHDFFKRDGGDLYCRVPITMATAILGGTIDVPAVDGAKARLKIPEGTQSGRQFRVKGKGMSVLRSSYRGDMYVQLNVETPRSLTTHQRNLIKEFDKGSKESNNPQSAGFFKKLRNFLDSGNI